MAAESHHLYQTRRRRPVLDEARGIYMWDSEGRRYVDAASGAIVSNIGHSNPAVIEAMRRQLERAAYGLRMQFESEASETLATRIAGLCPPGLDRVFFSSGGSEAVETAIKLARSHALARGEPQRWKLISRHPSYHGMTLGALGLTGYAPMTAPFAPMLVESAKVPAPRAYLDGLDPADPATGRHYADMLEERILVEGPETVLAFVVEPVGGASTGALVPPAGYLARLREICDRHGVLLIHDEVLSGSGRTGRFLAAEHWGVAPDIIVLSKGLAAGYAPLGATVARTEIAEAVLDAGGFVHGFTYGAQPLACAAGLAVLSEMERQGMLENAARVGDHLKARLEGLAARFPFIGDVRGIGLLLAVEFVADRETLAPLPPALAAHDRVVEIAHEEGLILYSRRSRGGHAGDHVLVCPPLITSEAQADEIAAALGRTLARFAAEAGLPAAEHA
jgi:adenosylmethionine-8-amino-7-oxononanoate aminotransferase